MKIKDTFAFWLIGIGGIVLVITSILFLWNEWDSISAALKVDAVKLGNFGSLISGLVGTLWALAGVILFYVALTEQRKDIETNRESFVLQTDALRQQIKEFEAQTKELEETRKVYSEQLDTQSTQRFENTFFQLLSLHHTIVDSMSLRDIDNTGISNRGRDCFRSFIQYFNVRWRKIKDEENADVVEAFLSVFRSNDETLSHYFRNLYHIFKFIDRSGRSDRKFYAGIIRAQLSSLELLMLFYNCLSENGYKKFRPLIEQYAVFKNLDLTSVSNGKGVVRLYKPSAYGQQSFNFLASRPDLK